LTRLAIDGGDPVRAHSAPSWPAVGDETISAVQEVLKSGKLFYWNGCEVRCLEEEYARALGRRHGVAVSSGTLALELALRAFGVGPGDEVIVPARTYIATAAAAAAVGATPVLVDVDRYSGNISVEAAAAAITPQTRAVIPVHVGGWPASVEELVEIAHPLGLVVIEDCAQAHGGARDGRPLGSLGSDAAVFSFCNDKIISTGEGGLLVLDDEEAFERAWSYRDHGKSLERVNEPGFAPNTTSFKWLVDSFGSNWRMPEVSGAMGRVGLAHLPAWQKDRTRNAHRIAAGLQDLPILDIPMPGDGIVHAYYRLYARIRPELLVAGRDRNWLLNAIAAEGAPVQYGTCCEIYRERVFSRLGWPSERQLPVAAELDRTSIAFQVHPALSGADVDDTVRAVRKVAAVASVMA